MGIGRFPNVVKHLLTQLKQRVHRFLEPLPTPLTTALGTHNLRTREAWLERTLQALPVGHHILDAGAGELQYKKFCQHLAYTSQDFAQYDGSGDQAGLQTGTWDNSKLDIVSDIVHIPRPDSSFDAIMCIEVLEHLPDPVSALRELTRLLKPGGTLIVTAPFCAVTHFSPHFYHTGYTRYFYEHWLERQLGYHIEEIDYNGDFYDYLAQEIRRVEWVTNTYAKRSVTPEQRATLERAVQTLAELTDGKDESREFLAFGLHIRARKK
jgi:ubiquinone/menaquinone biosynthesis C-methylase UbiE